MSILRKKNSYSTAYTYVSVYVSSDLNRNVSVWPMLGICVTMVDGLVCVPVNVNTVLFIWQVLACVVGLAGK